MELTEYVINVEKKYMVQLLLLIICVFYMLFNMLNFTENYSKEAIQNFKEERNLKILSTLILMFIIYLSGGFNLIF
jgi:hypothetical protein